MVDTSLLSGYDYIINPFSMEKDNILVNSSLNLHLNGTYAPNVEYTLKTGNEPKNDEEFLYLYPDTDYYYLEEIEDMVGKRYYVDDIDDVSFICSGIGYYKTDSASNLLYSLSTNNIFTGNNKLRSLLDINQASISINFIYDDEHTYRTTFRYDENHNGTKLSLHLPLEYENNSNITYQIRSNNIYDITDYDIVYEDITYPQLVYGKNTTLDNNPYFIYVNAGDKSASSVAKKIEKLHLNTYYFGKKDASLASSLTTSILSTVSGVITFFSVISEAIHLLIIFFITYFILSKVYNTRVKDFEILRILGVTKSDMARIVKIEIISIGLVISVISFIINLIIFMTVPFLKNIYSFNLMITILYFVAMFLFSLALAHRFNKKIYKFTASKSMRGEDEND